MDSLDASTRQQTTYNSTTHDAQPNRETDGHLFLFLKDTHHDMPVVIITILKQMEVSKW
jgi:hypothetical protein